MGTGTLGVSAKRVVYHPHARAKMDQAFAPLHHTVSNLDSSFKLPRYQVYKRKLPVGSVIFAFLGVMRNSARAVRKPSIGQVLYIGRQLSPSARLRKTQSTS